MKKSRFFSKSLGVFLAMALCLSNVAATGFVTSAADTNLISNGDFESGATTGWVGRGGVETLTATTADAHGGRYSMLVTGRTESWNGPSYDFTSLATRGSTYTVTAYVKAVDGQSSSHTEQATLSLQITDGSGTSYNNLQYQAPINEYSWTELSGEFSLSYSGTLSELQVYVESPDETLEYYVDDVVVNEIATGEVTDSESLCEGYADDFDVGVAVTPSQLNSSDQHSALIERHFNSLTAENCMKVESIQPQEGVFNFRDADAICDYAIAHNMKVRGHNLLWHTQVPSWFFTNPNNPSQPATRDQLLARLKTHITTVLTHFKEKYGDNNPIYCWDVCNEVISDGHQNNGLRGESENSKWLSIIGPDYIEKAFEYAHEADPDMKLYINDYNIENNNQKTTDMYNLVKSLIQDGVPIDGIGIQMHILNSYPSVSDVKTSIEKFASLGVSIQITEMDCSTEGDTSSAALEKQATRYKNMFDLFVSEKQYINSVTIWGVSDEVSWRGTNNAATLFDTTLAAKPALYAILKSSSTKNSTISPKSATFDLNTENQKDISVAVTLNGNTLSGIYNGTTALVNGTDYTVASDGTVTILKSYLAALSTGTASLKFDFSAGTDPVLAVTVVDTTSQQGTTDSTISPTSATFDLNAENQKDISVAVTLNGNTFNGIYNGSTALTEGTDYTVSSDGTVTILKSYLAVLPTGKTNLTFDFSAGTDPVLTVTVTDTTEKPGDLEVQMFNGTMSASTNGINPHFKLINNGTETVDLSTITLRYYFTEDGTQPQNFWCDYSTAGLSNITGKFVTLDTATTGADNYLEIGFTSGAGSLAAGASVEVQARFSKSDWTNYNQSDDYSFNSNSTSYTDWTKVTAYQNGTLVWGVSHNNGLSSKYKEKKYEKEYRT